MKSSSAETILFEDDDRDILITVAPFGTAGRALFTISNHSGGASFTAADVVRIRRALASDTVQQAIARHLPRESVL